VAPQKLGVKSKRMKKLILFELNEVPFKVLDSYCEANPQSTLAEVYRTSRVASTHSPDSNWLHPWCTWPTLHRGVDTTKHMLTNLSQDLSEVDQEYPPVWRLLADKGVRIGLGGSLHSWPMPANLDQYDFYLPDTFATDAQAHPEALEAFQTFNLAMVDKSARNVSRGIAMNEAVGLLRNFGKLGFGARTIRDITSQVSAEIVNPIRKGRRRTLQSVLAFDVFMRQLSEKRPDFATFFTNHVASSMHRYWVAKFPEDLPNSEYDQQFIRTYSGEIDYAMSVADGFLKRLKKFVDSNPEYAIALTTSMGQAASQETVIKKQVYIDQPDQFMAAIGVLPGEYARRRVMAPRFAVTVDSNKLECVREAAAGLKIGDQAVGFQERSNGFCMFHFGQENLSSENEYVVLNGKRLSFEALGLKNTAIEDTAGSTGYHIPEGMLLVYDPKKRVSETVRTEVGTTELAPMILSRFDIQAPDYMQKPNGFSLI